MCYLIAPCAHGGNLLLREPIVFCVWFQLQRPSNLNQDRGKFIDASLPFEPFLEGTRSKRVLNSCLEKSPQLKGQEHLGFVECRSS